ncbi:ABC transporter ATP-binding protein [Vibrio viridaestus]|uniref:ABC transporter ATP-binding protein n=1 Tax=Vibrio viridaestus TaxID=2487322 RepID=A0A3N9TBZ8_9VIBR|nr:ABC transporter ATP-binding protein [Vibrio viridaestus]RQW61717.1 ABC transporter ATP-binding protein [Vibrio viridaestus]
MIEEKILEIKNVGVDYREKKSLFKINKYSALKNVSFDIYKGENLGIIGRNGAGKSTLLRLLAGIIKPDNGEIVYHTKSISLMSLSAGFDPNLSGRQNAIISGMLIGYSKQFILSKIEQIKEFSELNDFFEKNVKSYSSGMRARLGFSISMYASPDILLIDEVLGVGDIGFKDKAEREIKKKISSQMTIVIVTHSERQLEKVVDRVVWINNGIVRKDGRKSKVLSEYNMEIKLNMFQLTMEKFEIIDGFILNVEKITIENGKINLSIIIINETSNVFDNLCINNKSLDGPMKTPGYAEKYPKSINSSAARYSCKGIEWDRDIILSADFSKNKSFRIAEFIIRER